MNEHLAGIYADSELDRKATIRSFRIVQTEGSRLIEATIRSFRMVQAEGSGGGAWAIDHYNLDSILASATASVCRSSLVKIGYDN